MRNWVRFCAVGFALVAFVCANLDTSPRVFTPHLVYHPDWTERFLESLVVVPPALLGGALWGGILGAGAAVIADTWRWLRH
jgi:hypothetical protein